MFNDKLQKLRSMCEDNLGDWLRDVRVQRRDHEPVLLENVDELIGAVLHSYFALPEPYDSLGYTPGPTREGRVREVLRGAFGRMGMVSAGGFEPPSPRKFRLHGFSVDAFAPLPFRIDYESTLADAEHLAVHCTDDPRMFVLIDGSLEATAEIWIEGNR